MSTCGQCANSRTEHPQIGNRNARLVEADQILVCLRNPPSPIVVDGIVVSRHAEVRDESEACGEFVRRFDRKILKEGAATR